MDHTTALALPDEGQFRADIEAINRFQQVVRSTMIDGQDYGVIPGTSKPTLLKPGAEKIAKLLGLADTYEILDKAEDWGKGFFRYLIKCQLVSVATGVIISEGLGECNSMESKYRWRWVFPDDVPAQVDKSTLTKKTGNRKDGKGTYTQYRIENDDIYSQVNTILKMGKKRALVDAALSAGRLSQVFTQDLEDREPAAKVTKLQTKVEPKAAPEPAVSQKTEVNINLEWLAENLPKSKWSETTAISWLKMKSKELDTTGSLIEVLGRCDRELQELFVKEVQDRADMV